MDVVIKEDKDRRGVGRPQVAMHRNCHVFYYHPREAAYQGYRLSMLVVPRLEGRCKCLAGDTGELRVHFMDQSLA